MIANILLIQDEIP